MDQSLILWEILHNWLIFSSAPSPGRAELVWWIEYHLWWYSWHLNMGYGEEANSFAFFLWNDLVKTTKLLFKDQIFHLIPIVCSLFSTGQHIHKSHTYVIPKCCQCAAIEICSCSSSSAAHMHSYSLFGSMPLYIAEYCWTYLESIVTISFV